MRTLVTKQAPEFTANAVMGNNCFKEVSLSDYVGKYVLLFFYPLDFTFVCPTEILAFGKKYEIFKKKNCEVLACSTDSQFSHLAWKNTPVDKGGIGQIPYPLVADPGHHICRDYGVLLEDAGIALRGLFLIDDKGVVRHALVNDLPLGRNIDEAIRLLDALQFVEKHGEVCPANWKEGEDAMQPSSYGVADYLSKHQ